MVTLHDCRELLGNVVIADMAVTETNMNTIQITLRSRAGPMISQDRRISANQTSFVACLNLHICRCFWFGMHMSYMCMAEGADTPRGPEAPSNERPGAAPGPPSFKCNLLQG